MKKSLFGYNPQEVDELVDSLQSQNDILTEKIAKLTMQLSTAESGSTDETVEEMTNKNSELEKSVNELKQKIAKTERSEQMAKKELDKARAEIRSLKSNGTVAPVSHSSSTEVSAEDEKEKISNLFKVTYKNCENMQKEVIEDMRTRVEQYEAQISEYNEKMHDAVEATKESYSELMSNFAMKIDEIFDGLSVIEEGNNKIEASLDAPKDVIKQLNDKMDKLINEEISRFSELNEMKSNGEGTEEGKIVAVSPIIKIKEKYFKDIANEQQHYAK